MLNQKISSMMTDLRDRQAAGERMRCPRCGRDSMLPDLEANSKCAVPGVWICNLCRENIDELLIEKNVNTDEEYGYYFWEMFKERRPASDFEFRAVSDVLEEVEREQLDSILELYKAWRDSGQTNIDELEVKTVAFLTLKGLDYVSMGPYFTLKYAAANGNVFVKVRDGGRGLQYSITAEENKD